MNFRTPRGWKEIAVVLLCLCACDSVNAQKGMARYRATWSIVKSPGTLPGILASTNAVLLPPDIGGNPTPGSGLSAPSAPGDQSHDARVYLGGNPGKTYVLEVSTNLVDWKVVSTNQASAIGRIVFSDAKWEKLDQRFYRGRLAAGNLLGDPYRPDRVLVKPLQGVALADLSALDVALGVTTLEKFPKMGGLQIVRPPANTTSGTLIARYQQSGLVEYAEHDYYVQGLALSTPNDPLFQDGSLWNLSNTGQNGGVPDADIDAPEAWDTIHDAPNVIVAVIDTGIRYTHEDLAPNLWTNPGEIPGNGIDDDGDGFIDDVHGINAITGTGDPLDDNGHGTHVSGIIGAAGNNAAGSVGVCWRVQLMACKFLNDQTKGSISDAITCIDYARAHGAQVINASWGSVSFTSQSLSNAIVSARDAGIIFVAACGNSSGDNDDPNSALYPASYDLDNIIAVAASTRTDGLATFSNYGATTVDLAAPGTPIWSCWNGSDSDYQIDDGTSMAAPHVAGAAALLRALYPNDSYRQTINRILSGVDPIPALAGRCATGGRLNLQKSLGVTSNVPVITLSAFDPNASEAGPDSGIIRFHRAGDPSQPIDQVNWTLSGTAANGTDYEQLPTSSPFPDGQADADLTITPIDDSQVESNETVVVTLAAGPGYTVGSPNTATVTIADNDQPGQLPVLTITAIAPNASEAGPTNGVFRVHRTGDVSQPINQVNWTFSGTAINGTDFEQQVTSSTFPAGQADADLTITPIDDSLVEGDETVIVNLAGGSEYTVGSPDTATVTIADNDQSGQSPVITITSITPNASETGPTNGIVTFHRTGDVSQPLNQVNWTFSGTAINGTDYEELPTSSSFPAGQADANLTITPIDDSLVEGDETVIVNLASGSEYTIGSPDNATVTIADNDSGPPPLPTVTVAASNPNAAEPDVPGTYTISRTGDTSAALTVSYSMSGTATGGADYNTLSGSVTLTAGAGSADVTLTPIDDTAVEGDETAVLTLANNSAYNVGTPNSATVTIADNDSSPSAPTASFSASPTSGDAPLAVQFTDSSSGNISSRAWDFGDGSTSSAQNPSHTFSSAGDYTVTLTVTGPGGSDSATTTISVSTPPPPAPTASFSASPTSGNAPLSVQFTDSSSGNITSYAWNFGDGGTSSTQNPSHTFSSTGDYTVTLTVTGPGGSDSATTTISVSTPPPPAPTASFSASPTSGDAPLAVQFTDSSSGSINSRAWDFGDGGTSSAQNPSHTFSSAGDYTVTLTVTGPGGSDSSTTTISVSTPPPPAPTASFSASPTSGNAPLAVQFADSSSGSINSRAWDFGDGGTSSAQNPSHTFSSAGSYTVTLTVTGPGGSDSATTTISVSNPPPPIVADFSASSLLGLVPLVVDFTDRSTGNPVSWNWNFGDGSNSTAQNPTHIYLIPGSYTVTLTVENSAGDSDSKSAVVRANLLLQAQSNSKNKTP